MIHVLHNIQKYFSYTAGTKSIMLDGNLAETRGTPNHGLLANTLLHTATQPDREEASRK